jgi:hypothetical protein
VAGWRGRGDGAGGGVGAAAVGGEKTTGPDTLTQREPSKVLSRVNRDYVGEVVPGRGDL